MLRDLVHLHHSFAHLCHTGTLLGAGRADGAHEVGHAADRRHHFGHGGACLVHLRAALLYALHTGADQAAHFFGGIGGALRQCAYFGGHHRKSAALFACARCFNGRIERQNVGLKGNGVDDAQNVCHLAAAVVDAFHGLHHLGDCHAPPPGDATSARPDLSVQVTSSHIFSALQLVSLERFAGCAATPLQRAPVGCALQHRCSSQLCCDGR